MRLKAVLGLLSSAFLLAMMNACGDDSSSGFGGDEHGDKPYCEVRSTKTSVKQEIFVPNTIWGEVSVTFEDDQVVAKMVEEFYNGYTLDRDSVCDELSRKYTVGVRSFSCDKDGASVTIRGDASRAASLQDIIAEMKEECNGHEYSWINSSGKQVKSSSSSKENSSSSEKSSSSNGSSSSALKVIPKTKIVRGDVFNAFTDERDGNAYRVVQVGDYVWMLDNLRYAGGKGGKTLAGKVYCSDCGEKGRLYNYAAAMDNSTCLNTRCNRNDEIVQGACPDGWVLPPDRAWNELEENLDEPAEFFVNPIGEWSDYWDNDGIGRYWSSTEDSDAGAREYYYMNGKISSQGYSKSMGYAIRCIAVKDVVLDTLVEVPEYSSSSTERYSSSYGLSSSSAPDETSVSSSSVVSSSSIDEDFFWRNEAWAAQDTFIDARDGQSYRMTEVDGMIWMAENLRYRDSSETPVLKGKTWCIGANEEFCEYGVLYTFDAAMADEGCASGKSCGDKGAEYRGICPEGWHIPSGSEWTTASQWLVPGSQELFGAVATGEHGNGSNKLDQYARFWSSREASSLSGAEWYVSSKGGAFASQNYDKNFGYAVRCVKNAEKDEDN